MWVMQIWAGTHAWWCGKARRVEKWGASQTDAHDSPTNNQLGSAGQAAQQSAGGGGENSEATHQQQSQRSHGTGFSPAAAPGMRRLLATGSEHKLLSRSDRDRDGCVWLSLMLPCVTAAISVKADISLSTYAGVVLRCTPPSDLAVTAPPHPPSSSDLTSIDRARRPSPPPRL